MLFIQKVCSGSDHGWLGYGQRLELEVTICGVEQWESGSRGRWKDCVKGDDRLGDRLT